MRQTHATRHSNDYLNPAPLVVERQEDLQRKIDRLFTLWLGVIARMEGYEGLLIKRLAEAKNVEQARLECDRWGQHRIDTLCAMKTQLFESWLEINADNNSFDGSDHLVK